MTAFAFSALADAIACFAALVSVISMIMVYRGITRDKEKRMAGAHDERESVAARTGMSTKQRDTLIWTMHHQGKSQRQIAAAVGMTQPGVLHAINRLSGKTRIQSKYVPCECCGDNFPANQLIDGRCARCEEDS